MKTPFPRTLKRCRRSLGFLAAFFCFLPGAQAASAIFPGRVQNSVLFLYAGAALFVEAVCVAWQLRKFHRPPYFVLWVLGTHLLTFPGFLGMVWLLQPLFQSLTIALAEGLVVLAEGWMIYQICRRPDTMAHLPLASAGDCWFAALVGNAVSLVFFWLLLVPVTALFG